MDIHIQYAQALRSVKSAPRIADSFIPLTDMSFNLRACVPARPKVPGHTPNPLSVSHETNPYNPVTKPDPNGTFRHPNNTHPLHILDFHGGHFGHDHDQGTSFGAHAPEHLEPVPSTGLGIHLAHEELHRPQHWHSGAPRLGSMTAPEGSMRASATKENRKNAENLPKRKLKLPWGVDSDKLVQKVLHDLKTRGAPYELLESVQGIH